MGAMTKKVAWALVVAAVCTSAVCAQGPPTCVTDEALRDQSLVTFRVQLRAAFASRNLERLRPLVSTEVDVSGVGAPVQSLGFDAFRKTYGLDDLKSQYWAQFEHLLALGGTFQEDGTFCAPSFSCPGATGLDPGDVFIAGIDVPAHAEPNSASPVISSLQCGPIPVATDVAVDKFQPSAEWFGVLTKSGEVAFVLSDRVETADVFVELRLEGGRWQLVAAKGVD